MKFIVFLSVVLSVVIPVTATCAEVSPETRDPLPVLQLTVPDNLTYQHYLGLKGAPGDSFKLSDIDADLLIIELFSMYCPYCQKEAPLVNELYEKMDELSTKGIFVKIIGLGASNSLFEVEHFRDTYNVPFPLFPDKDLAMYKALQGAGTPGFIGVNLRDSEGPTIILRNSGGFYSTDEFLKDLVDRSGL